MTRASRLPAASRSRIVAFALAILTVGATADANPMDPALRHALHQALAQSGPAGEPLRPFSIVIRGGISLGVYESGVNWALLRLLKDLRENPEPDGVTPELMAAAGASAGAINGFLAGLMWCTEAGSGDGSADTMDSNVLRDAWIAVDINGLLDYPEPPAAEDKAAFSREVLRVVQRQVGDAIDARAFRQGCSVAFGVSLTRSKPVLAANAGVQVPHQRLVLPLVLRADPADPSGLAIRNFHFPEPDFATTDQKTLADRPFLNSVIYLDADVAERALDARLPVPSVFDAIKASASFPVAFAPTKLSYCLYRPEPMRMPASLRARQKTQEQTPDRRCPPNYRRLSSFFVDGGVFDNDPLELVRQLSERQTADAGLSAAPVQYIRIDPGRRRPPTDHFEFALPEYAQAGDSVEIALWAGGPSRDDGGAPTNPETVDIETVMVRHCVSGAQGADGAKSWRQQTDYEVVLTESAVNSQYFEGTVHTRPSRGEKRAYLATADIEVEPEDRLLVFSPRETDPPTCDESARPGRQAFARRRSIGIVGEVPPGLSTQLGFLGGSVTSARSYRLYDELMGSNWHDGAYEADKAADSRPLFQPARLTPLVGDYLFAFGAFLDGRFRDYDYYAGVYDAVYGVAEYLCFTDGGTPADRDACRGRMAEKVYLHLCAPGKEQAAERCAAGSPLANAVIYQLVLLETCGVEAAIDAIGGGCELAEHWQWARSLVEGGADEAAVQELLVVGGALLESHDEVSESDRDPFVRFVRKLADRREELQRRETSVVLNEMLDRAYRPVPTWYYSVVDKAVPRLLDLQDEDKRIREGIGLKPSEQAGLVKGALALTGFAYESEFEEPTGWLWDQTSVPENARRRWLAALAPSELAVDSRNGGAALYWNPGFRFTEDWGIDLRFGPYLRQRFSNETIEFTELSAFVTRRLMNPFVSSLGIGPTATYTWSDEDFGDDTTLGASASVGLLADKLRITYGVRSLDRNDFAGDDIYWHIGVNDIPGIAYWLCRALNDPGALGRICGAD